MNTQEISQLLEKYYKGESSEEEELTLKSYFKSDDLPDEFQDELEIFTYYSETAEIPEPSVGFEGRIINAIKDNEDKTDVNTYRRRVLTVMSAAAGILLLIGSYFIFMKKSEPKDTFSDPRLAYAETVKILYNISSRMNHGTKALEPVVMMKDAASRSISAFNKSTAMINENLKNLDYFQKALNIVSSPLNINKETNSR